jgi:hypothetical protein
MAKMQEGPEPNTKIRGQVIGRFNGLTIYGKLRKAKTYGKNRIWIHIRQAEPKRFRVSVSLAYARAVDVQFEQD